MIGGRILVVEDDLLVAQRHCHSNTLAWYRGAI